METNLVFEGLKFMVLGMGTVFLFLILMIVMMNVMSYLIHKYFPEPVAAPSVPQVTPEQKKNNNKIAAIAAAIMHHNQNR